MARAGLVRAQLASGILRGAGRQRIGAILNFVAFYFVALPVGFLLAFKAGQGLFGLWWGLCIGLCFCTVSFMIIIYRFDWPVEVGSRRAAGRVVRAASGGARARARRAGWGEGGRGWPGRGRAGKRS